MSAAKISMPTRDVLIVEDEPLIALELHNALHLAGASILAATNIEAALGVIAHAGA